MTATETTTYPAPYTAVCTSGGAIREPRRHSASSRPARAAQHDRGAARALDDQRDLGYEARERQRLAPDHGPVQRDRRRSEHGERARHRHGAGQLIAVLRASHPLRFGGGLHAHRDDDRGDVAVGRARGRVRCPFVDADGGRDHDRTASPPRVRRRRLPTASPRTCAPPWPRRQLARRSSSADVNDVTFYANLADPLGPDEVARVPHAAGRDQRLSVPRGRDRTERRRERRQLHVHGVADDPNRRQVHRHDAADLLVLRLERRIRSRRRSRPSRRFAASTASGSSFACASRRRRRSWRSTRLCTSATPTTTRTTDAEWSRTWLAAANARRTEEVIAGDRDEAGIAMIIVMTVVMLLTFIPLAIFTQAIQQLPLARPRPGPRVALWPRPRPASTTTSTT